MPTSSTSRPSPASRISGWHPAGRWTELPACASSGVGEARDGGCGAADDRDRAGGQDVADEGVVPEDVRVDAARAVPAVVADPVDDVAPAGRGERAAEVLDGQPG